VVLGTRQLSILYRKRKERQPIYAKCMKYLTFLDYTALQAMGRSTEADLEVKEKEIAALRGMMERSNLEMDNEIQALRQHLSQLQNTIESSKSEMMAERNEKARLHTEMFRRDLLKEMWATGKDMRTILKEMALAGTKSAGVDPFGTKGIVSTLKGKPTRTAIALDYLTGLRNEIGSILKETQVEES
jgi:predicted RNase H-like nuclease (RuvC/YqgF family)